MPKTLIMNPGNYIKLLPNKEIEKKITDYKFNAEELKKFRKRKLKQFTSVNLKEKKLEMLKKETVIDSFVQTIKNGLNNISKINFKVILLIKFKNQRNFKILINLKNKKITKNVKNDIEQKPELAIFSEFYKIANLVSGKYPMNFMTFHNGSIICERESSTLSKNEKTFWNWIYNLSF